MRWRVLLHQPDSAVQPERRLLQIQAFSERVRPQGMGQGDWRYGGLTKGADTDKDQFRTDHQFPGLVTGEIIGIAIGVGAIVVTIAASAPATIATTRIWRMAKLMHEAR